MFLTNFILIACVVSSVFIGGDAQSHFKVSRAERLRLFPHPRVGRTQAGRSWQITPLERGDYHDGIKRQGLIPFPRVGRSEKLASPEDLTSMWFGPRLGRVAKRAPYMDENAWTMFALKEMPQHDFTPRLGRESEETVDENEVEPADIEGDTARSA